MRAGATLRATIRVTLFLARQEFTSIILQLPERDPAQIGIALTYALI